MVNDERHELETILNAEMVYAHSQREREGTLRVEGFDIMFSLSQRNAHKAPKSSVSESVGDSTFQNGIRVICDIGIEDFLCDSFAVHINLLWLRPFPSERLNGS